MKTDDTPYFLIQSVERALAILNLFIQRRTALGVTEIAKELKLHKSVVHRLLATLQAHHYTEKIEDSGKYKIGPKAFELGSHYMNTTNLFSEARPFLHQLVERYDETAHLAILDDGKVMYIVNEEPARSIRLHAPVGEKTFIHSTALGKCLTAWLPEEEVRAILAKYGMAAKTPHTIVDPDQYIEELAKVRMQGYAVDNGEGGLGIRCVSVPIWAHKGEVVAAMSVSGNAQTITEERVEEVANMLKFCARSLSERLGYFLPHDM